MKTASIPTRVQHPHDRKSWHSTFGSSTTLAALLALLGGQSIANAQSDNFNDGEDTFPVAWTHVDVINTALGGASPQNTYDASTFQYHLTALPSPNPVTLGPARTMSLPSDVYTDFYVSVDVTNWDNSIVQAFGLLARGSDFGPLTTDGYLFGYASGGTLLPSASYITIVRIENDVDLKDVPGSGPGGDTLVNIILDPLKDYRFVFMGHGTHLEGRVYELPNVTTPIAVVMGNTAGDPIILTSGQSGVVAFNLYSATLGRAEGPADATFDNYYASARCPMTITDMVIKDNFNDGNDTAPTVAWQHYDPISQAVGPAQNTWSFPGGNTYRLQAPVQPFNPALGQGRVGSVEPTTHTDFRVAIDIVDWDNTLNQDIGIAARLAGPIGLGTTTGYLMSYDLSGGFGDIDISLLTGEAPTSVPLSGEDSYEMVSGKSYRFVFSGKGSELRALVFELPETMNPLIDCIGTDATYGSGNPGLIASAGSDAETADVTFDNYSDTPIAPPPSVTVGSTPGGNVTVTWPGNLECIWVLESSPTVGTGAVWTEVPLAAVVYEAGLNTYTGPTPMATSGNTFYRLKQL